MTRCSKQWCPWNDFQNGSPPNQTLFRDEIMFRPLQSMQSLHNTHSGEPIQIIIKHLNSTRILSSAPSKPMASSMNMWACAFLALVFVTWDDEESEHQNGI
jgi:hypothetical protein